MKKELAATISSISKILKVIKDGSILSLEKSKSLASMLYMISLMELQFNQMN
jgi:methyl-accepting chemotaxis protein